jgi:hypothetical protein
LLHQLLKGFNRFIYGILKRPSMQLVKVYVIGLQPTKATLHGLQNVFFTRVPVPATAIGAPLVAYFGSQHHFFATAL